MDAHLDLRILRRAIPALVNTSHVEGKGISNRCNRSAMPAVADKPPPDPDTEDDSPLDKTQMAAIWCTVLAQLLLHCHCISRRIDSCPSKCNSRPCYISTFLVLLNTGSTSLPRASSSLYPTPLLCTWSGTLMAEGVQRSQ